MRIQVGKGEENWSQLVWTWVHTEVQPKQRVFLPAGNTPLAAYRRWSAAPSDHLRSLKFLQIDDILTGPQQGVFRQFFVSELEPYLPQFEWIGAANQAADVAILGVGVNGHVAFHEPLVPRDFYSGCVPLSQETRQYLQLREPTWGVTFGAGAFLSCKKVLILARGPVKQHVLKRARTDQSLPISWMMRHRDVTLISDFEF